MKRMISQKFPTKHEFSSEIFNYLFDNKVWVDSVYSDYIEDTNTVEVSVEIEGGWKHDHLRADYLMSDYFSTDLVQSEEEVLEEDGSDSCLSRHIYVIENADKYFNTNKLGD